jgi:hypothetical protein
MSRLVGWPAGLKLSSGFLAELKVVDTHPPNWDLSQGLFWVEGDWKPTGQTHQQLLFLNCFNTEGDNLIVRIDYTFDTVGRSWAWPRKAKVLVGQMLSKPPDIFSLFDILTSEVEVDKLLSLQQNFIFGQLEPSGDESQISESNPRQRHLQLNQSDKHAWKIDLVDVNDPSATSPMVLI